MGKLVSNREEKLKNLARDSYAEVLEKRHKFLYRKIARAAVLAVASREKFIASLRAERARITGSEISEEEAYEIVARMGTSCRALAENLLATCE